jgi:uncharacterized MAPEG superfamily protein
MGVVPILPPLAALALFAVWTLLLVLSIGAWRTGQVFAGQKKANDFPSGTKHGSDAYWRLNRAHLNAVENLPIFGSLVLAGVYLQIQDTLFPMLPSVVLYARIVQSLIHISSGDAFAVTLRFAAYAIQVVAMLTMAALILQATGIPVPW